MQYNPIKRRLCDISGSSSCILFNCHLQMQGLFQSHLLNFHDWLLEIKKRKATDILFVHLHVEHKSTKTQ